MNVSVEHARQSLDAVERRGRIRRLKDSIAKYVVAVGGIGVIGAILLIFFFLAYVVVPLFLPADIHAEGRYPVPGPPGETLHLSMEEQAQIGVRYTDGGALVFFDTRSGSVLQEHELPIPAGTRISAFAGANPVVGSVALGFSNGEVLIAGHAFEVSYPNDRRLITPHFEFPLGEAPLVLDPEGQPLQVLGFQSNEDEATAVATTRDGRLVMTHVLKEANFITGEVTTEQTHHVLPAPAHPADFILLSQNQRHLFVASRAGELSFFDITAKAAPEQVQAVRLVPAGRALTALSFLTGELSLLAGDSEGSIRQWALTPDEAYRPRLNPLRSFHALRGAVTSIGAEQARKGFVAVDANGQLGIFHATAHNTVLTRQIGPASLTQVTVAPRANAALVQNADGGISFWELENPHPEVSWSSLWGKVWYESYPEPAYIWQSSSALDDFEPKFSLVPLTFGTIKAAFYAMLVAIPLSILGALYAAHFMAPRMRQTVKPTIEIMEALPTVILGFLAGLWLAPFIEKHLPGVFSLLLLLPLGMLGFAWLWQRLPARVRNSVPEGWEAALLLPVVGFLTWLALALSPVIEGLFFGGDMRLWLTHEMGISFDQRNAIVIGLAMGFAVIPTIFSIAEDAVFGVPKHLVHGSLALGATHWQTLIRVVLPSASPGIFSAVMIGFGRAVGETMIVLMATGNTPVMDFSPFEGLRTLSANIAVELPESELGSTHYRILFLAGLVLFLFTFLVNTVAEIIRQRLRRKYSSL